MMDKLFSHCAKMPPMKRLPEVGECCATIIGDDFGEWYRAKVVETISVQEVSVLYVDFGLIAARKLNQLKEIDPELITIPQQAIECCLVDFENLPEVTPSTGKQIEMYAGDVNGQRKVFRVKVHWQNTNSAFVVNLHDESNVPGGLSGIVYRHSTPRKPFNSKSSKSATDSSANTTYETSSAFTDANSSHNTSKALSVNSIASSQQSESTNGNNAAFNPDVSALSTDSVLSEPTVKRRSREREADGSEGRRKISENNNEPIQQRRDRNQNRLSSEFDGGYDNQDQSKRRNDQRKSEPNHKK